ncbi:uncharacterized protein [Dysidea avara]|uniref:uncharacterized protein isoform X1 n=1 Tax=Dysidea avara TaxID=196820 RepID=UPI00332A88AA
MPTLREVYDNYYVDLITKLPMDDVIFVGYLQKAGLFSGDSKAQVGAKSTTAEAATCFMDTVINRGWTDDNSNPQFDKLLKVMGQWNDTAIKSLAANITTSIAGGRTDGTGTSARHEDSRCTTSTTGRGSDGTDASARHEDSRFTTKPNVVTLTSKLSRVSDWKKLCVFLLDDVDGDIVPRIEQSNFYKVEKCQDAMFREFIKSGDVTWEKVLESLKLAGYKNLAIDIEKQLT